MDTKQQNQFKFLKPITFLFSFIQIDRYKPLASDIQTRFPGGKTVPITRLNNIPDLSIPLELKRDIPFSLFNPSHSKMAAKLIEIFMS